jgi:hypothetical protein
MPAQVGQSARKKAFRGSENPYFDFPFGRNIEKQVPFFSGCTLLRILIEPPRRRRILWCRTSNGD